MSYSYSDSEADLQMEIERLRADRSAIIEECARVAEQWYEEHDYCEYPQGVIRAIRALKDKS